MLVNEVQGNSDRLDPDILLEALFLSDAHFSQPVTGAVLLASLRHEGLIRISGTPAGRRCCLYGTRLTR